MTAPRPVRRPGFSLLEVMIAVAIFFLAVFTILDLTSQNLGTARALQLMHADLGSLATLVSMTNRLEVGPIPAAAREAFEELNPGYTCEGTIDEVATNGLFQVNLSLYWESDQRPRQSSLSFLLWRPDSNTGARPPGMRR